MHEIAAFCYPEMRKKNSSIPRVVSTIKIDISGDLKFLSMSQIMLTCFHMSHVVRKPFFCICVNKDADQLRGNHEADQRLCFRYTDSTIPLLSKSKISSF